MEKFVILITMLAAAASFFGVSDGAGVEKAKLKFKVSGRDLRDKGFFGTSDPYFIVSLSEDGGNSKSKIGRSDTIQNQKNPDWSNVFEVNFDRNKNQYLYFHLWDNDRLREDDTLGRVWVNVADYVDRGQLDTPNLDKQGYLIIKNADGGVGSGLLPMPAGTPDTQTLRFMISANGLPTKDDIGFIPIKGDPYVMVVYTDGPAGSTHDVGRTSTVSSSKDPSWSDVMTFKWSKTKDQRLRFRIYDDDNLRSDDKLGQGWMEVNDYVAKGQIYTVILPKKGTLTIRKA
ncbi:Copine-8 [Orchesella cincta]|uniref:Copine-8 n=1 Tax=Orchesella cincta TaxID=48709 RepID=A0A1D2MP29_ORCCI|nr:Copine-8 [Orchesella cincta]